LSLPVRFSAEAAAEFSDASLWYEEKRLGLGEQFIGAVETAIGVLADWPGTGARVGGLGAGLEIRRAPVTRFPYHLVYLVDDDHLRILAVAHDRRRPGYWAPRARQ
jgi:plasmid stabilization system protein ParE